MKIFRTTNEVRRFRNSLNGGRVSFVPTMGCLHEGHLDLGIDSRLPHAHQSDHCYAVRHGKSLKEITIASIFVNPAQFAPHEDLDRYPRMVDADLELFRKEKTDAVFIPEVSEMYPNGIRLPISDQPGAYVEVSGFSHQLEGKFRPTFFRGVCTVVTKLLNIVRPERLILGQKDAQQCVVLRRMVQDLKFDTEVTVVPTRREANGLAMSSRNRYLSPKEFEIAATFHKALRAARDLYEGAPKSAHRDELLKVAESVLRTRPEIALQYLSLAEPTSLAEVQDTIGADGAILSGAILLGKTRLIDNILLGRSEL